MTARLRKLRCCRRAIGRGSAYALNPLLARLLLASAKATPWRSRPLTPRIQKHLKRQQRRRRRAGSDGEPDAGAGGAAVPTSSVEPVGSNGEESSVASEGSRHEDAEIQGAAAAEARQRLLPTAVTH